MKNQLAIILILFMMFSLPAFAGDNTVFVIESYHAEYPWDASYKQGLTETLGSKYNLVFFEMDTKRLPASEYERMAGLAWEKYKKISPALVILGDDNAVKYLAPKFAETDTPVVYLGLNRNPRDYGAHTANNITGVLERPLLRRSIASLKTIITPSPKKILVLFDNGTTSQASVAGSFKGRTTLPIHEIMVQLKMIGQLDEWKNTVMNLKTDGFDAVVIGLYHTITDAQEKHVEAETLLKWTIENTPVPPFGFWDFTVGADKTVGGFVLFGKTQGEAAGKIALKILEGKRPPSKIKPRIPEMGRFLFSRSQLKKWKLTLPADIASKAEYVE